MPKSYLVLFSFVLVVACAAVLLVGFSKDIAAGSPQNAPSDARLKNAYRSEQGGWIYVHLEGAPARLGFQHGYLLAPEIADGFNTIKLMDTRRTKRDWQFFRTTAEKVLWPHIEEEYRHELQGIADGLKAHGVSMDVWDVVALNAFEEISDYYVPWLDKQEKRADAPHLTSPGNCSAFVATGSYTKGGHVVMAHNAWTSYHVGARWNIIFDLKPERGHRILMDGFPGVIISDDDFGINDAGLMVTETTITQFFGFDPNGKPEFMRARKAMQYATTIDEFAAIMKDGNNGGYANDWLVADKSGEIAQLELGLKNVRLWRTKDGYFAGSNWARDPQLIKQETTGFDPNDPSTSPNARRKRWEQLMAENKGKIDATMAEAFLSDHYDTFEKKHQPSERALCGHVDTVARGIPQWEWGPHYPGGAVQGKVTDSEMTKAMSLRARMGHPCGGGFKAASFLTERPDYSYMKPVLRDMPAGPWTTFKSR